MPGTICWLALSLAVARPARADDVEDRIRVQIRERADHLLRDGFFVTPGDGGTFADAYRDPKVPVFVTADSALAAYLVLLREAFTTISATRGARAPAWVEEWEKALIEKPGEGDDLARFYVGVLSKVCGRPLDSVPAALRDPVEREWQRMHRQPPFPEVVYLGTPFDHDEASLCWSNDDPPDAQRWNATLHWLTRARLPASAAGAAARERLQATIPPALRDAVLAEISVAGNALARFPGTEAVIDFEFPDDCPFPRGVLPDHGALVGLALAARMGSRTASRAVSEDSLSSTLGRSHAPPRALASRFDRALSRVLAFESRIPEFAKSDAYDALAAQTRVAASALWRRAVGPRARAEAAGSIGRPLWPEIGHNTQIGCSGVLREPVSSPACAHPSSELWGALRDLACNTGVPLRDLGDTGDRFDGLVLTFGALWEAVQKDRFVGNLTRRRAPGPCVACAPVLQDGPMRWIHGVAAPDTIWVAYPWKGETILCRGAVFSLREMPANRALSDADWRGVLKTPLAKRPAWTAAFLSR